MNSSTSAVFLLLCTLVQHCAGQSISTVVLSVSGNDSVPASTEAAHPTPQPSVSLLLTSAVFNVLTSTLQSQPRSFSLPQSELLVPSQTTSPGPASYSTAVELFPSSSADILDVSTQGPVTSATIYSSPQPSIEPPTDSGSSNVIEFIRDRPIAFIVITVALLFVICSLSCLCCVVVYRKRSLSQKRKKRQRRDSTVGNAEGLWMANAVAIRPDSSDHVYTETDVGYTGRTLNTLQTSPSEAVVISNPCTSQLELSSPPPQYHELQNLPSNANTRSPRYSQTSPTSPAVNSGHPTSPVSHSPCYSQTSPTSPAVPTSPVSQPTQYSGGHHPITSNAMMISSQQQQQQQQQQQGWGATLPSAPPHHNVQQLYPVPNY